MGGMVALQIANALDGLASDDISKYAVYMVKGRDIRYAGIDALKKKIAR